MGWGRAFRYEPEGARGLEQRENREGGEFCARPRWKARPSWGAHGNRGRCDHCLYSAEDWESSFIGVGHCYPPDSSY